MLTAVILLIAIAVLSFTVGFFVAAAYLQEDDK